MVPKRLKQYCYCRMKYIKFNWYRNKALKHTTQIRLILGRCYLTSVRSTSPCCLPPSHCRRVEFIPSHFDPIFFIGRAPERSGSESYDSWRFCENCIHPVARYQHFEHFHKVPVCPSMVVSLYFPKSLLLSCYDSVWVRPVISNKNKYNRIYV